MRRKTEAVITLLLLIFPRPTQEYLKEKLKQGNIQLPFYGFSTSGNLYILSA
jgi:hypothetical protein